MMQPLSLVSPPEKIEERVDNNKELYWSYKRVSRPHRDIYVSAIYSL